MRGREGRTLTPHQREMILERDLYICAYCGGDATVVDHVVPWSYSQCDDDWNLVGSCVDCNAIASDHVFPNLGMKTNYIRAKREGKKWTRRLIRRVQTCTQCGRTYWLRHDATHMLCSDCAPLASMTPDQRWEARWTT